MLAEVPKIKMPKRAKGSKVMKGRPITGEEFDRMLDKVDSIVNDVVAPSWRYLLRGLWLSGLRLDEALNLYWDRPDRLRVDLDGRRPMFHILAEHEKGKRDRLLPMAPEFAEMLDLAPENERRGRVFKLVAPRTWQDDPNGPGVGLRRCESHRQGGWN